MYLAALAPLDDKLAHRAIGREYFAKTVQRGIGLGQCVAQILLQSETPSLLAEPCLLLAAILDGAGVYWVRRIARGAMRSSRT